MYSSTAGVLCPVASMPAGVPLQIYKAAEALPLVSQGMLMPMHAVITCAMELKHLPVPRVRGAR